MPVRAKQLVLCTNIHCARGVFTDDECKQFCPDCGSPCIELCPNPDCRVRILDESNQPDSSFDRQRQRAQDVKRGVQYAPGMAMVFSAFW
jgi:hypothetical protein